MNKKVQQTVIDAQNFNSLGQLRKMQNLLIQFEDTFGQINWNQDLQDKVDIIGVTIKIAYLRDSIGNWVKAIKEIE